MNQSNSPNKAILVLLVVALISLVGLSGFLYYKLRTTGQQAQTSVSLTTNKETPEIPGEPIIADIEPQPKEYSNPEFKLSFLYPPYYTIQNVAVTPKKAISVTFSDGASNQLVVESTTIYTSETLNKYKGKVADEMMKLELEKGTVEWKMFYPEGTTGEDVPASVRAQVEKNGRLYSVTGKENLGIVFEMLSSFQF